MWSAPPVSAGSGGSVSSGATGSGVVRDIPQKAEQEKVRAKQDVNIIFKSSAFISADNLAELADNVIVPAINDASDRNVSINVEALAI